MEWKITDWLQSNKHVYNNTEHVENTCTNLGFDKYNLAKKTSQIATLCFVSYFMIGGCPNMKYDKTGFFNDCGQNTVVFLYNYLD